MVDAGIRQDMAALVLANDDPRLGAQYGFRLLKYCLGKGGRLAARLGKFPRMRRRMQICQIEKATFCF